MRGPARNAEGTARAQAWLDLTATTEITENTTSEVTPASAHRKGLVGDVSSCTAYFHYKLMKAYIKCILQNDHFENVKKLLERTLLRIPTSFNLTTPFEEIKRQQAIYEEAAGAIRWSF